MPPTGSGVTIIIAGKDDTGAVFDQIEQHLARTRTQAEETGEVFGQLGERITRSLEYMGIYFGAREIVDGLKELVTNSLEYGEQIERASKQTGLAAGTLSTLHYAAAVTGGDFDSMTAAVSRMDRMIAQATQGNKQASAYMKSLGLDAQKLASDVNGPEIAFRKLAQVLGQTNSPVRRTELASGVMGQRAGAEQIATLIEVGNHWDEFTEKAKAAGVYLNDTTAEQIEEANRKLEQMKQDVLGAGIAFTQGLTPGLEQFFNVITGGKTPLEAFHALGERVAAGMNLAGAAVAGLVSGMYALEAVNAGGKLTEEGRYSLQQMHEWNDKVLQFREAMVGDPKSAGVGTQAPPASPVKTGSGYGGVGDLTGAAEKLKAAKEKLAAADRQVAASNDKLDAARAKAANDVALADLEDRHKRELVSDADYYKQKAAIQQASIEAEKISNAKQQGDLQAQVGKLNGQKLTGVDAINRNAQVEGLQARINELKAQAVALGAKETANASQLNSELAEVVKKRREDADALAVAAEKASGAGVAAQLKQSHDAYYGQGGERDKVVAQGGDLTTADTVQQHKEGEIGVSGAEEGYQQASEYIGAERAGVDAQVSRGMLSSVAAQQQKIALDHEEAEALEPVLDAYQKLADAGDLNAAAKVAELQEKIAELKNPVSEVASSIRTELNGALEQLWENLGRGGKAWQQFEKSLQSFALKQTYEQFLQPLAQVGLGKVIPNGGGFGGGAHGAAPSASSAIGGWLPKLLGVPGVSAKGAGSGVTVQIINQTSSPAQGTASQQSTSDGSGLTEMLTPHVIQIMLTDLERGGSFSQALTGLGGAAMG